MGNLTSLIGGGNIPGNGIKLPISPRITDGVNILPDAVSAFLNISNYLALSSGLDMGSYNSITQGIAFKNRITLGNDLIILGNNTVPFTATSIDYIGIEARNFIIEGVLGGTKFYTDNLTYFGSTGFSGGSSSNPGTNMMQGLWDFMPITAGGQGASGATTGTSSGVGGGLIFIVADSLTGTGEIRAIGGNGSPSGLTVGGCGGIIIICTKAWGGGITLNVSTGTDGGTSGGPKSVGSYCILRINGDSSLTLMVYSEIGVSAVLNGQTPVHGADASIAW